MHWRSRVDFIPRAAHNDLTPSNRPPLSCRGEPAAFTGLACSPSRVDTAGRSAPPMASFNPPDYGFGFEEPPPRPATPPVRRGFLLVLFVLCIAALIVYGVPYVADRVGYSWEAGRARAAAEALAKLDKAGAVS